MQVIFLKEGFFLSKNFLGSQRSQQKHFIDDVFLLFLFEPLHSNNFHGILLILFYPMDFVDTTIRAFKILKSPKDIVEIRNDCLG